MRRCKRTILCIWMLVLLMAVCCACGKETPANQMDLGAMDMTGDAAEPAAEGTPAASVEPAVSEAPQAEEPGALQPVRQSGAVAEVTAVATYAFDGTLYAACEYQNIGDTPLVLSEAAFSVTCGGNTVSEGFTPIAAENDVIAPGDVGYCTLWLPADGITAGTAVTAEATLTAVPASVDRVPLYVAEARLIQNYPGFATLSGKLKNGGSDLCELNVIYAGFYDANGTFLGAWHFTRAVTLKAGDSKAFVSHLRALPIPDLAENATTIKFSAFGL